jgi:hypothetical protein
VATPVGTTVATIIIGGSQRYPAPDEGVGCVKVNSTRDETCRKIAIHSLLWRSAWLR